MWVSGTKLALFCFLHSGKGGAIYACVHGCVELFVCWGCVVLIIIIRHDCFGLGFVAVSALEGDKRLECCVVVPVKILRMYYTTSLL